MEGRAVGKDEVRAVEKDEDRAFQPSKAGTKTGSQPIAVQPKTVLLASIEDNNGAQQER